MSDKIRVAIDSHEWYPVYSLSTKAKAIADAEKLAQDFPGQHAVVEIDPALLKRHREARRLFIEVQNEIGDIMDALEDARRGPEPVRSFAVRRGFQADDDGRTIAVMPGMTLHSDSQDIPAWLQAALDKGDVEELLSSPRRKL